MANDVDLSVHIICVLHCIDHNVLHCCVDSCKVSILAAIDVPGEVCTLYISSTSLWGLAALCYGLTTGVVWAETRVVSGSSGWSCGTFGFMNLVLQLCTSFVMSCVILGQNTASLALRSDFSTL